MFTRNRFATVYWLVFLMLLLFAMPASAQIAELEKTAENVMKVLTGSLLQTVLTITLIILGIGLVSSSSNPENKKRFVSWLIAVAVVKGAASIVGYFYNS